MQHGIKIDGLKVDLENDTSSHVYHNVTLPLHKEHGFHRLFFFGWNVPEHGFRRLFFFGLVGKGRTTNSKS